MRGYQGTWLVGAAVVALWSAAGCDPTCDWEAECAAMNGQVVPDADRGSWWVDGLTLCGVSGEQDEGVIGATVTEGSITWDRNPDADGVNADGICRCGKTDYGAIHDCGFHSVEGCAVFTTQATCEDADLHVWCVWNTDHCTLWGYHGTTRTSRR